MRILLVDDYSTKRRTLRATLVNLGYTDIDEAIGAPEALSGLRSGSIPKPDVIITDWSLSNVTGLDFIRELRQESARLSSIPCIIMTNDSSSKTIMETKTAGANGWILQPFTSDELKAKIDSVVAP